MKTNMKTQNKTIPTSQPKSDPKAIHTHRRITSNFRMIPHAISQSKELSFRDKGILLTLLSYPDDWIFHLDFISKEYGVGKDALKTSFRELVKRGYLRHVKVTGAHQRIVKYVWQVTNVPTDFVSINEHVVADSPLAVPPVTGFPASGESATTDRDRKTDKENCLAKYLVGICNQRHCADIRSRRFGNHVGSRFCRCWSRIIGDT